MIKTSGEMNCHRSLKLIKNERQILVTTDYLGQIVAAQLLQPRGVNIVTSGRSRYYL